MKLVLKTALQLLSFCLDPAEVEATKREFRESVKGQEFFLVDPGVDDEFYQPLTSLGYRSDGVLIASNGNHFITINLRDVSLPHTQEPVYYAEIDRNSFVDLAIAGVHQGTELIDLSTLLIKRLPKDNIFACLDLSETMSEIVREGNQTQTVARVKGSLLSQITQLAASLGDNDIDVAIFTNEAGIARCLIVSIDGQFLSLMTLIKNNC